MAFPDGIYSGNRHRWNALRASALSTKKSKKSDASFVTTAFLIIDNGKTHKQLFSAGAFIASITKCKWM